MKKNKNNTNPKTKTKKINYSILILYGMSLLLAIGMIIIFLLLPSFFQNNSIKKAVSINDVECLKMGNVCSSNDIKDGIKVQVPVNSSLNYDFYVISNTEDSITLLFANNLKSVSDWSVEMISIKGPTDALGNVNNYTKEWISIPYIGNYSYVDYGYDFYKRICIMHEREYDDYDCDKPIGYKSLTIRNGRATINYNLPVVEDLKKYNIVTKNVMSNVRSRLITFEEVNQLSSPEGYPEWLIENLDVGEYYWTLSSDPMPCDYYNVAAYTVMNKNGKVAISPRYIKGQKINFKLSRAYGHLRPVITIPKQ